MHHAVPNHTLRVLFMLMLLLWLVSSQVYWISRVGRWLARSRRGRLLATSLLAALLLLALAYNLTVFQLEHSPTTLTWKAALLQAPLEWWVFGSVLGFGILVIFGVFDRLARALLWCYRKLRQAMVPPLTLATAGAVSSSRREFLERTAVTLGVAPFVAGAYGLFYGRLNLQVTHRRIALRRCPRALAGFRIAQLSDLHIGPFMPEEEIRKYVGVANALKPDLIALTGDYVTWDPSTQGAVVNALSGLKAPFGVFGCLGNHELWTETEDSITRLFAERGIRILRGERVCLRCGGEEINLVGVDFQTRSSMGRHSEGLVHSYLDGVEKLVRPDTVNILLSHNPNTFDRAAQLGIDLSLAGHTHGGQVALEFVHYDISPSRLITPYVRGLFRKPGGQLYVNCGIGTIGVPIRLGAPPEISLFELVPEA